MTPRSADWRWPFPAFALAFAALVAATCGNAAELPPEIRADRHLVQAERQVQAGEHEAALATLDKIVALQQDHGLAVPSAFWFKHAQVARDAGRFEQAIESATRYLIEEGQQGQHYMAALEILDASERMKPHPFSVVAEPAGARIRLLDIGEPYRQGLPLPPGEYRVEVSADGHLTAVETVHHRPGAPAHRVILREHFQDCPACPEMVVIPPGSFRMGCLSDDDSCPAGERPVRIVRIPQPFALSKHEVTFADWDACVAAGGCGGYRPTDRGWGRGNRPVIHVSWRDAQAYASWLSEETGEPYRLPSESEWEYAARAGTVTKYSWGDLIGRNRANCDGCGSRWDDDRTAPVGSFAPNPFGLHDMHGNVWEWVEDCWNGSYSGAPSDGGAWLSGDCAKRVLRGGSWGVKPRLLRSALRGWNSPGDRLNSIGFRVARTLTP